MAEPSTGFQVQPDQLADGAAEARSVAARLPAQADRLTAAVRNAAAGLPGWRTAAALADCAAAWHELLATLARELAQQAEKLDDTARHYRAGDRSATDAFLPAGHR
ncbi:WXG100 family type VII secretion target [Kitasatospora viridis]|uniref:Excreted virulence factor EspC (Type VII ESX diderm) n=1 Tax=Kitasatospora viridis TaxID=281105 RepID=A0A561UFW3_9ACTN|nr:hypothetical protein [Kitasatospora viridis]TWF98252.1 hypothetical protein FHX73_112058 [Kitasatospora viridis]